MRPSGMLRDTLTLSRMTSTTDAHGVPRETFTALGTFPAAVYRPSANARSSEGHESYPSDMTALIDTTDVRCGDRATYKTRVYEVIGVNDTHRLYALTLRLVVV